MSDQAHGQRQVAWDTNAAGQYELPRQGAQ
jgi:hypothetical protein